MPRGDGPAAGPRGPGGPDPRARPPHEKLRLEPRWAELVYDGLWFSPLKQALDAFFDRVPAARHRRGPAAPRARPLRVVGRRSPISLYDYGLATYDTGDTFAPGRRGVRPALGPWRGHLVGGPGGSRRRPRRTDDPLARPPERRHRRRGHGSRCSLHYRPAAGPRRPGRFAAHVRGLDRGGLLTDDEVAGCCAALDQVEAELADGTFAFAPGDEDIHTAVERRVTELAGEVGAKLHTGRSRNDQVATDLRLYAKRELTALAARGASACRTVLAGPGRGGRRRLPARLHPPAAGPAGAAGPPPAGPWLGPGPRRRPAGGAPWPARRVPAGRRGAGRLVAAARPGRAGRGAWLRRPVRQLARRRLRP